MTSKAWERLFLFASGFLFFLLSFILPPVTQHLLVNFVFNISVSFGSICMMLSALER